MFSLLPGFGRRQDNTPLGIQNDNGNVDDSNHEVAIRSNDNRNETVPGREGEEDDHGEQQGCSLTAPPLRPAFSKKAWTTQLRGKLTVDIHVVVSRGPQFWFKVTVHLEFSLLQIPDLR